MAIQTATLTPPPSWMGSLPEYYVYDALIKLGMKGEFIYQSSQMGGRGAKGGAIVDFYFPSLSLAINVQSTYFHYRTASQRVNDQMLRAQLEGQGIRVIYIQEAAALSNATHYVRDALRGIEHT